MGPSLNIESELKINWDVLTWVQRCVLLGHGLLVCLVVRLGSFILSGWVVNSNPRQ